MRAQEITDYIFQIAPNPEFGTENIYEIGGGDTEVKAVGVAWWITSDMLEDFARRGVTLGITHERVIYDVPGRDNETRSAEYFQSAIRESGANAPVAEVVAMILATQRHEISGEAGDSLPLFLDIDLSILGASRERFAEYDAGIRREYSSIADTVYRPERRRVLQRFLDRPALYFTSAFRERYEAQARANLQQAVRMLALPA